jgi:hypothetical protein
MKNERSLQKTEEPPPKKPNFARLNQIRTSPPLTLEFFWQVFTVHLMAYYL